MLSATAARQARVALRRDIGCKEVDFRMRVIRDGISFQGTDFVGTFRDFVMRRRRFLATTVENVEDFEVKETDAETTEDPSAAGGDVQSGTVGKTDG